MKIFKANDDHLEKITFCMFMSNSKAKFNILRLKSKSFIRLLIVCIALEQMSQTGK